MKIQALQVGSIGTNCYILCDEAAKVCAVIDPGAEPELVEIRGITNRDSPQSGGFQRFDQ